MEKRYRTPECECPRPYTGGIELSDAGAMTLAHPASSLINCFNLFDKTNSTALRTKEESQDLPDKYSLLSTTAEWMSDFTDEIDITLRFHQRMLVRKYSKYVFNNLHFYFDCVSIS